MGKFCAKCGSELSKDSSFCVNCGTSTKGEVNTTTTQSTSEGPTRNGMATAGFVLSFFVPLLGLIFSIIGLRRSGSMNGNGKGLSIAGLILSIIGIVSSVIIYILYYSVIMAELASELY